MTAVDTTDLTAAETDLLATAEAVIERGLRTFFEVGDALMLVRENRLYRGTHATFEEYCQARWRFSDSRARQLIGAAQTVTFVTEAGLPAPGNEAQARALIAVPEDERAGVWQKALVATGGRPTAAAITETWQAIQAARHALVADHRWECRNCAHTWTAKTDADHDHTAKCPNCDGWFATDLGVSEPDEDDEDPADELVQSHCTSCGHIENLEMTPPWCYRCGVAPAQIKTGLTADHGHNIADGRCLTCAPLDNPGELVYIPAERDAVAYHRLRAPRGSETCCGARTKYGVTLTRRRVQAEHNGQPCGVCWPGGAAVTDAVRLAAAEEMAAAQAPAEPAPAQVDLRDGSWWHCRSCGHARQGHPGRCLGCGSTTNFVSPATGNDHDVDPDTLRCLTCAPHGHALERVWLPELRGGAWYHQLTTGGMVTACGTDTVNKGKPLGTILTRGQAHRDHAGQQCKQCWPEGHRWWCPACEIAWWGGPGRNYDGNPCPSCASTRTGLYANEHDGALTVPFDGVHALARSWTRGPDSSAGAECKCGDIRDGFAAIEYALLELRRHAAAANAAADDDTATDPEPDEAPALPAPAVADVNVWMAADRRGLAYHRLQEHAPWTGCARSIGATGRVMTRAEAVGQIGGKPCRACYPGGDPDPVAVEAPAVESEPAPPVLEGEIVTPAPERPAPATSAATASRHFKYLVEACALFADGFDGVDLPAALAGFDPGRAHFIARAAHIGRRLQEFLDNAAAAATAPDASGQVDGQLDILAAGTEQR